MNRHHVIIALFALPSVVGCGSAAEEAAFRSGPLADARAGAPQAWEGSIPIRLGATPFRRQNEGTLDPATGNLSLRLPVHEWNDRLPGALTLVYESQAADPARRFRLDIDRELVESETGVVVEDAQMRPLAFADTGGGLVAPTGVFAELVATPDGGYDFREYATPDIVDHFAPANGTCCFLAARVDPYGNAITVTRDEQNRLVTVAPAVSGAIEVVWTEDEMTALELPSSTTNLGWDAGRLVSMTPGALSGSYLFEYEHNGDPQRLARVTVPGGATLDIVTAADGGTTRIEVPGQRIDVAYTSSTRVDVTMTPGTASAMLYSATGELVAVEDVDGTMAFGWTDRALTSFTDKLGRTATMAVDDHGHITGRSAFGFSATYVWADDRIASATELGTVYTVERNAQGAPITESWPVGAATHARTHSWTEDGLLASSTELGSSVVYVWNADDTLQRVEQNGVVYQSYDYDPHGRLVAVTNGRGGTTTYGYANDQALIPVTMTLPSGVTSTISADVPLETNVTIQPPGAASVRSTTTVLADGRVAGHSINGTSVVQYSH